MSAADVVIRARVLELELARVAVNVM